MIKKPQPNLDSVPKMLSRKEEAKWHILQFKYLKGVYIEHGDKLFSVDMGGRTRNNGLKVLQAKARKNFLAQSG